MHNLFRLFGMVHDFLLVGSLYNARWSTFAFSRQSISSSIHCLISCLTLLYKAFSNFRRHRSFFLLHPLHIEMKMLIILNSICSKPLKQRSTEAKESFTLHFVCAGQKRTRS
ncbi:hypothetical protein RJT34_21910 [Clitoria ternatea]|uniref:Uncharacterized protein n=1 Tax=Clitoria ternatea TaxID=43366 RepID=A0AAN9IV20_CLITE